MNYRADESIPKRSAGADCNIDDPQAIKSFADRVNLVPFDAKRPSDFSMIECNIEAKDLSKHKDHEVAEWFERPATMPRIGPNSVLERLEAVELEQFVLVGHKAKTFVAVKLKKDRWLLLDCHADHSSTFSTENLINYFVIDYSVVAAEKAYYCCIIGIGEEMTHAV